MLTVDCRSEVVAENVKKVGWSPAWDREKMLQSLDDEIRDVLGLGEAKSSLLDSLKTKRA